MITCPVCGGTDWQQIHRCPVDPASDEFTCCGVVWKRYAYEYLELPKTETEQMKTNLEIAQLLIDNTIVNEGATYNPKTDQVDDIDTGYLVSLKPYGRVCEPPHSATDQLSFVESYVDTWRKHDMPIGVWRDENNNLHCDVNTHCERLKAALTFGVEHEQKAVYDCEVGLSLWLEDQPDKLSKRHVDNVQPHSTGEAYPLSVVTIGNIDIGRIEIRNLRSGRVVHVEQYGEHVWQLDNVSEWKCRLSVHEWLARYVDRFHDVNDRAYNAIEYR